jgi:lambda repressor-like predicted transcriptional regulator
MDNTTDTSRKVAAAVSAALGVAGISVLTAAEQTGIPRSTLTRRLTGTSPFTIVELELVANLLGQSVEHFIVDEVAA